MKQYSKEWWSGWRKDPLNYKRHLIKTSKWRSKKHGLDHNLTIYNVDWADDCPMFGVPLVYRCGKEDEYTWWFKATLDRIDPSRGYTTDNVRVMSFLANYMLGGRVPAFAKKKPELLVAFDLFTKK